MNLDNMKQKYAYTLARVGLNVQPGQPVLVEAAIEGRDFVPIFAEECYKLGASNVIVHYLDLPVMKVNARYRKDEDICSARSIWTREPATSDWKVSIQS